MLKAVLLLASAFAAVSTADYSKTYSGLPSGQQEKLSGAKFYMDHLPSLSNMPTIIELTLFKDLLS